MIEYNILDSEGAMLKKVYLPTILSLFDLFKISGSKFSNPKFSKLSRMIVLGPDRFDLFWRFSLVILLIGFGGFMLAACADEGPEQLTEPMITVNPQGGGGNSPVVVSGSNFPAGMEIMLRLGPPDVGATPFSYGSAVTDDEGNFTITFIVPERWPDGMLVTAPELTVIALNEDGSVKATAPFAFQANLRIDSAQTIDGVLTPDPLLVANEQAIVAAVMNYLTQIGESTQVAIAVELMEGEYARVNIVPVASDSEGNSTGYLKLVNSVWEVLVVGRDFDSDQLLELGIPEFMIPEALLTPEG